MTYKVAVLPGDGIGSEIVEQAVRVLKALELDIEFEEAPVGGAAYESDGHPLPERTLELAKNAEAILFGAVGDWKYDSLERHLRPEQAILGLRKALGLFANLRPAILYPELANASSLKPEIVSGLDLLIVRELTGDIILVCRAVCAKQSMGHTRVRMRALIRCATQKPKFVVLLRSLLMQLKNEAVNYLALTKQMYLKLLSFGAIS